MAAATRAQILAASLAYAVKRFYFNWSSTSTLPNYSVFFGYSGNWWVAKTGTQSKYGYYSSVPLDSAFATLAALTTAANANAVDKSPGITQP
jgi:hypothetical protein